MKYSFWKGVLIKSTLAQHYLFCILRNFTLFANVGKAWLSPSLKQPVRFRVIWLFPDSLLQSPTPHTSIWNHCCHVFPQYPKTHMRKTWKELPKMASLHSLTSLKLHDLSRLLSYLIFHCIC